MRRAPVVLVVLVALLTAVATAVPSRALAAEPPAPPTGRILVMPFENVSREGRIVWVGEAVSVLLADDLNTLGFSAITRDERRAAFERLQVPPAVTLTDATVIRIGQLVGAAQVVIGTLQLEGDTLVVHARSIALEAGRIQSDATERGGVPDLFATVERLARTLAPSSHQTPEDLERARPSLAAFENFIKGLLADTPATATGYLTRALQAQPSFDRARLALWDVYNDQDDDQRALAAVTPVPAASPYAARARFLQGLSELALKKYDDAFATFTALSAAQPAAPLWNNLGVVQLRRGASIQKGQPVYFFTHAVDLDGTDADYFFNLGYAYWWDRDMQAAIYWLREAVRRNPADGEAHFVLGAALAAGANPSEAAREKELARRLSSTFAEWDKRPAADPVPHGLERVKSGVELPHAKGAADAIEAGSQRDQRDLAQFYLGRGRRLYEQENDREALAELSRVLYLSPYQAEAHLLIGRIDLRQGRLHEAVDAFKISLWSAETAEGHAALAQAYLELKDPASARTEADRAVALDPASADAAAVREKIAKQP